MNTILIRNTLVLRQHRLEQQLAEIDQTLAHHSPAAAGSLALDMHNCDPLELEASRLSNELIQLKRVLKKMGYQDYGICQRCGAPIEEERLEVHACSHLCADCAQAH